MNEIQKFVRDKMDGFLGSHRPLNLVNILALIARYQNGDYFYTYDGCLIYNEDENFKWKLAKPNERGFGDLPVELFEEQETSCQLAIAKLLGYKGNE